MSLQNTDTRSTAVPGMSAAGNAPHQPPPELLNAIVDDAPDISADKESAWAAIAKSMADIDEGEIKKYQEDIDNILVFAGLYSAVLSALIAISLTGLQPDSNAVMIALLSQIAAQTHSYTISSAHLNSTVAPLDLTTTQQFAPSIAAKRVNVLWFASLTLSLISASFGILVKQWLREYLANDHISPLHRLRIRYFRASGLWDWQVLTIAGLLPLFLQLALALFFVGLCFFTLDIHPSIGYTTIPLVAGWSLLFIAALLAPVMSPRCPYKIPLFKPVMQYLRESLFHSIPVIRGLSDLPDKSNWPLTSSWSWWSLGYSEDDAAKDGRIDVDNLLNVDEAQQNDQLVVKMCSALQELHASPVQTVFFVFQVITSRLQTSVTLPAPPAPYFKLDLSKLSAQTCTILMDTVAEVLAREVRRSPLSVEIRWNGFTYLCLSLLFSRLPCRLSDKAAAMLALCWTGAARSLGTCQVLFAGVHRDDRPMLCLSLLTHMRPVFSHLDVHVSQMTIWMMLRLSCCDCGEPAQLCNGVGSSILQIHQDTIPPALRQYACELLTSVMLQHVKTGVAWNEWFQDTLYALFTQRMAEASPRIWQSAVDELVMQLLVKPNYTRQFYRSLFDPDNYCSGASFMFHRAFCTSNITTQVLFSMHDALSTYLTEVLAIPTRPKQVFYGYLIRYIEQQIPPMRTVVEHTPRPMVCLWYIRPYRRIWDTVHTALSQFDPKAMASTEALQDITQECLESIDELDDLWLPPSVIGASADDEFENWAQIFRPSESFFDDSIIEDLMVFLPSLEDVTSKRVRRVLWQRSQAANWESRPLKREMESFVNVRSSMSTEGEVQGTLDNPIAKAFVLEPLNSDSSTSTSGRPRAVADTDYGLARPQKDSEEGT